MKSNFRRIIRQLFLLGFFLLLSNLGTTAINRAQALEIVDTDLEGVINDTAIESQIIINEVMFYPEPGSYEWVELKNVSSSPVSIRGWGLTDEDGNWYKFPQDLPDVPAGDFVVVIFDGHGSDSNDLDLTDHVINLHSPSGLVDILEDEADQLALYSVSEFVYLPIINNFPTNSSTTDTIANGSYPIKSFVAWGSAPGLDAIDALSIGLWTESWYVNPNRGTGFWSSNALAVPSESIGLLPDHKTTYSDDWYKYQATEVTLGNENPVPGISWFYPDDGSIIDGTTFAINWNSVNGAIAYQFQLDDNIDFNSPITDTILIQPAYIPNITIPEASYYWRVKVVFPASEGFWSSPTQIQSVVVTANSTNTNGQDNAYSSEKDLGISWQLQHKDTLMLDLDPGFELGQGRWDSSHEDDGDLIIGNGKPVIANNLDAMYCVNASISMFVSFYGGHLSQDRISYQVFGGDGDPRGDLGHGQGMNDNQATDALKWALGTNSIYFQAGKPSFQQIKDWIDSNQPIMSAIWYPNGGGHMRVIDGYREILGSPWIHLLDPGDRDKWVFYSTESILSGWVVWVGPAGVSGAPNVRSDEDDDNDNQLDTVDDTDRDGVSDFDELNRFGLDPTKPDWDRDGITDKYDIREYVFDNNGNPDPKNPDIDYNGERKRKRSR